MDELFKQYGGPIITVVAIVALIAVVTAVIRGSGKSFSGMIEKFTNRMDSQADKADKDISEDDVKVNYDKNTTKDTTTTP